MFDNGKQFDNPKFRAFCVELGIKNYYSSPAHPQSNGQAEVTIRTLKAALKTKLEDLKGKWVDYLPEVLWAYCGPAFFITCVHTRWARLAFCLFCCWKTI